MTLAKAVKSSVKVFLLHFVGKGEIRYLLFLLLQMWYNQPMMYDYLFLLTILALLPFPMSRTLQNFVLCSSTIISDHIFYRMTFCLDFEPDN